MAKILKHVGANTWTVACFYLAIVQAVLLYGANSWALNIADALKLERFHWQATCYMSGCHIQKEGGGSWSYPDNKELLKKCGLHPISVYIACR